MNNQQAINLLKNLEQSLDDYCELNDEGKTAFRMAITALELFGNSEQLPSAQPERKKGKWINEGRIVRCSKCKIGYAAVKGMKSALTYNFCPHCGADMRGAATK